MPKALRHRRRSAAFLLAACLVSAPAVAAPAPPGPEGGAAVSTWLDRTPDREIIYFVLPDRFENGDVANDKGGLAGGRLQTGFDPTHKGFFHGGDLKGLRERLDYVAGLGATAIWLGPIYKNKPVQGGPGEESAGYHGYWITDFTDVDPHFGTRADLKALVDAAHARGIKVYLDIITNHTADIIRYRECSACDYRGVADFPYTRRGGAGGAEINQGFGGTAAVDQRPDNFARLKRPDWAYTPFVPAAEARAKRPAWLNDPIYYHNRGNSTFAGESSLLGDFFGLDDLFTEHPRVLEGMIEIYGQWIDDFGLDGFRVDTARHVNPEFWQAFVPAMKARARARGIPNFLVFGEVADPDAATLARFTRVDGFPAVLDFAFAQAVQDLVARGAPTAKLASVFALDPLYAHGEATAKILPTFIGNHDQGRFATFVRQANPKASEAEIAKRVVLGHAFLFFSRGTPTIYYGDEQGFAGDGNDQDAREDMFPSRVASYNDNRLVGSDATNAVSNFDTGAMLYREIAAMAALRRADPALMSGEQIVRASSDGAGLFVLSRLSPSGGGETLIAFNTSTAPVSARVQVEAGSARWEQVRGDCAPEAAAPGSYRVAVPPLDYIVCRSVPRYSASTSSADTRDERIEGGPSPASTRSSRLGIERSRDAVSRDGGERGR